MGATMLLSWLARGEPLATMALVVAIASGLCGLLGIGLIIFEGVFGRAEPAPLPSTAPIEPELAGFLATGLVTMDAARWVPAAILQLACAGQLAVVDRRGRDLRMSNVWDPSVLLLESTSDPGAVALLRNAGESAPRLMRALFGGTPQRGERVELLRKGEVALRLTELTAQGVQECHEFYAAEPTRGKPWRAGRISTVIAGVGGLIAIILATTADDLIAAGIGHGVLVLSAVAFIAVSGLLDSDTEALEQLNPVGKRLRAEAGLIRRAIGKADITSVAEGEQILPWAVLFDVGDPIDRLGALIDANGSAPAWYRTEEPATRLRFVSCIDDLVTRMRTPLDFSMPPGGV